MTKDERDRLVATSKEFEELFIKSASDTVATYYMGVIHGLGIALNNHKIDQLAKELEQKRNEYNQK